jgi:hypothetical protein
MTYDPASAAENKTKDAEKADLKKGEDKLKEEKEGDKK